jgi:hypothetical protein
MSRRTWENQPRAPKGTEIGGQWPVRQPGETVEDFTRRLEEGLRELDHEEVYILDPATGEVRDYLHGTRYSVPLDGFATERLMGSIMIHNHPQDPDMPTTVFSPGDLIVSDEAGCEEIRVVGAEAVDIMRAVMGEDPLRPGHEPIHGRLGRGAFIPQKPVEYGPTDSWGNQRWASGGDPEGYLNYATYEYANQWGEWGDWRDTVVSLEPGEGGLERRLNQTAAQITEGVMKKYAELTGVMFERRYHNE